MYGWVIAAMLSTLLREEGMLQIAFSWISQKVGFTNKRKHDPPKRENIFNLASDKIPGKMVPASGSVGVACKPTCCLLSPSFNEYTRNCSLGTKKAQIGDKISAPAPRQSDTGVVADQTQYWSPNLAGFYATALPGAQISPDERRTGPILTTRPNPCPVQNWIKCEIYLQIMRKLFAYMLRIICGKFTLVATAREFFHRRPHLQSAGFQSAKIERQQFSTFSLSLNSRDEKENNWIGRPLGGLRDERWGHLRPTARDPLLAIQHDFQSSRFQETPPSPTMKAL